MAFLPVLSVVYVVSVSTDAYYLGGDYYIVTQCHYTFRTHHFALYIRTCRMLETITLAKQVIVVNVSVLILLPSSVQYDENTHINDIIHV